MTDEKQWKLVGSLLQDSHPRSHTHCSGAALSLAQHGQCDELISLLRQTPDISPSELTLIIKCLISGDDKAASQASKAAFVRSVSSNADSELKKVEKSKKQVEDGTKSIVSACLAAAAVNGFSAKQVSCHPLLALHPDAGLLLTAAKRLHSQQLVFLLRYLLQWLQNVTELDVIAGGMPQGRAGVLVPSLNSLLIWLSAVVDAGNMRLSSSDTGISVLRSLLREVKLQVSCVKGLESLSGLLEQLQRSSTRRHASGVMVAASGYTVECLNI